MGSEELRAWGQDPWAVRAPAAAAAAKLGGE